METISVIIPMYNEENYIKGFMDSLLQQDYDLSKVEFIFIDGNSNDNTLKYLNEKMNGINVPFKILHNEKRITPISLNIGIKNSVNDIIIRLDVHSEYPKNYFSKCVYYINNIDADNVGCPIETISKGIIGNSIAEVLSSKFGVGNSKFRTDSKSGYVDTVPFGTFKRELFDKIGLFDERLERNQDIELNNRIIKNGGKIYLFNDIKLTYHPRNTIKKLIQMAITSGKWNIYTSYLIPGSLKLRHFVPLFFVLSLIIGIILILIPINIIKIFFLLEMILYIALDLIFSFKSIKKISFVGSLLCILIYPIFDISYGIGSILGIGKIIKNKFIKGKDVKK